MDDPDGSLHVPIHKSQFDGVLLTKLGCSLILVLLYLYRPESCAGKSSGIKEEKRQKREEKRDIKFWITPCLSETEEIGSTD